MAPRTSDHPHLSADAPIVVGTDGSDGAAAAVRWAARTAADRGRRLHIVSCSDFLDATPPPDVGATLAYTTMQDLRLDAERALTVAREIAVDTVPDIEPGTEVRTGGAAAVLVDLSRTAHLLVLGTTESAGRAAHLGSTLLAVTAHARGGVVVVRGAAGRTGGPVVVGVDGSPVGEPAVAAAFAEAAQREAELVAVHAWSDLSAGQFAGTGYLELPVADFETGEAALLSERLAGWSEKYPEVRVRREVVLCGPRERLGEWSRTAQLIVVGSRGRGGFRGLLFGSTGNWLIQHAECPVLIAHPE
ncbi:universal stress protein [Nocardia thailandica]